MWPDDLVGAHDPGAARGLHRGPAAGRVEMADGHVLHPLDEGHVVDVPVPVDRALRDGEFVTKDGGGRGWLWVAHGRWGILPAVCKTDSESIP
jgi:hypothetical protein